MNDGESEMSELAYEALRSRHSRRLRVAGFLVAALVLAVGAMDVWSSNAVLSAGGGVEVNPLHRWTQMNWGAWWMAPKMLIHVLVAAMVVWFPGRAVLATISPIVALTGYIVWNNLQIAAQAAGAS